MRPGPDRRHTTEDFLDAIEAIQESGEAPTTRLVAERLEYHRETARERLLELEDEGAVERRSVGSTHVWSVVDFEE